MAELTGIENFDYTNFSGWTRWETRWKDIGVSEKAMKFYPTGHSLAGTPIGQTGEFFTRVPHNVDQYNYLAGLVNSIDITRPVTFLEHFPNLQPYTSGHFIVPKDLWNFETQVHKKMYEEVSLVFESDVTWSTIRDGMVASGWSTDLFGLNPREIGGSWQQNPAANLGITSADDLVSYQRYSSKEDGSGDHNIWVIKYIANITGYVSSFVHSKYGTEYDLNVIRSSDVYGDAADYSSLLFEANWRYDNIKYTATHERPLWKNMAERMGMTVSDQSDLPEIEGEAFTDYFEQSGDALEVYSAVYDYQVKSVGKPVACDPDYGHATGLGIFGRVGETNVLTDRTAPSTGAFPGWINLLEDTVSGNFDVNSDTDLVYSNGYPLAHPYTSQSFYASSGAVTISNWTKDLIDPEAYMGKIQFENLSFHRSVGCPLQENRNDIAGVQTEVDWVVKKEQCSNGKWDALGYGSQSVCEGSADGVNDYVFVDSTTLPFTNTYHYSIGSFRDSENFLWSEDTPTVDQKYKNHGLYGFGKSYEGATAPTGVTKQIDGRLLYPDNHSTYFWGDPTLTCQKQDEEIDVTDTYCCPEYGPVKSGLTSYPVNQCWANPKWVTKLGGVNVGYELWYNHGLVGWPELTDDTNVLKAKHLLLNSPVPAQFPNWGYNAFLDNNSFYLGEYRNEHHWNSYALPPYKGALNRNGAHANGVENFYWLKTGEVQKAADTLGLPLELRRLAVPYKFKEFNFTYTPTQKNIITTGDVMYDKRMGSITDGGWGPYSSWRGSSTRPFAGRTLRSIPMGHIAEAIDPKPSVWTLPKIRQDFIKEDNHGNMYDWNGYDSWNGIHWIDKNGYVADDFADYPFQQTLASPDDAKGMLKVGSDLNPTEPVVNISKVTGYSPIIKKVGQFVLAEDLGETEWIRPIPLGHYSNPIAANNSFKDFPMYTSDFVKNSDPNQILKPYLKTTATWSGNSNYGFWEAAQSNFGLPTASLGDASSSYPANAMFEVVPLAGSSTSYRTWWFAGMREFHANPIHEVLVDDDEYKGHMFSMIANLYPKNYLYEQLDTVNNGTGSAIFRHYHSDAIFKNRGDASNWDLDYAISWIFGRPDETFGPRLSTVGVSDTNRATNPAAVIAEAYGMYYYHSGFLQQTASPASAYKRLINSGSFNAYDAGGPIVSNPVPMIETEFVKREVKRFDGVGEMLPMETNDDSTVFKDGNYIFFNNSKIFEDGEADGIGRIEYGFYINNGFKFFGSGLGSLVEIKPRKWDYPSLKPRMLSGSVSDSYPAHGPYPTHGVADLDDGSWVSVKSYS